MKKIAVEDSIGTVLAHDLTRITKGVSKGIAFRKGHIILESDLPILKDMGKNHLYILELGEDSVHENNGVEILGQIFKGINVETSEPGEGKVNSKSRCRGRLEINLELLNFVNSCQGVITATRHTDSVVEPGDIIGGSKVIPLTIDRQILDDIKNKANEYKQPLFQVKKFIPLKIGVIVTGSEVFYGRIKDTFSDVIEKKISFYGGQIVKKLFAPDDMVILHQKAEELLKEDIDLLIFTGGMSVDPDDLTPSVISELSTDIVTYGSPVLPGAMFMVAYKNALPILGVPAGGMYSRITVLDLVLPRIFTQDRITKEYILGKAHGGLCLNCSECSYPNCSFGK